MLNELLRFDDLSNVKVRFNLMFKGNWNPVDIFKAKKGDSGYAERLKEAKRFYMMFLFYLDSLLNHECLSIILNFNQNVKKSY